MDQDDLFTPKREVELAEDGSVVGHGNPYDDARARLSYQADAEREFDPEFEPIGNEPEPEAQEQAPESEGDEITAEDRRVAEELRQAAKEREQPSDEALAIARKLQNSTEEEAAQYLAQLRKQQPTQQDLERIVEQKLQAQAMQRFSEQNQDIFGNHYLNGAAGAAFQRMRQAGDTRSDLAVMGSAVSEVRTWVRSIQTPQPQISQEKIERKASITKLPTASARVTFEREDDDEDTGEVIQQMARARGQQYAK
jgi:hypothetical protein